MPKQKNTTPAQPVGAAAVALMKRQMRRQLWVTVVCLLAICASTFAFVSRAWFSNNQDVDSNGSSITSDIGTPSLFIRTAGDTARTFSASVSHAVGATAVRSSSRSPRRTSRTGTTSAPLPSSPSRTARTA
jgi:hypothetical protein